MNAMQLFGFGNQATQLGDTYMGTQNGFAIYQDANGCYFYDPTTGDPISTSCPVPSPGGGVPGGIVFASPGGYGSPTQTTPNSGPGYFGSIINLVSQYIAGFSRNPTNQIVGGAPVPTAQAQAVGAYRPVYQAPVGGVQQYGAGPVDSLTPFFNQAISFIASPTGLLVVGAVVLLFWESPSRRR